MKKSTWVFMYAIIGLLFVSCSQKESGIHNLQVGGSEDAQVSIGQSILVEADINLDQPIDEVHITVDPVSDDVWRLEATYHEELRGRKIVKFSQSIPVPLEARPGKYILTFKVKQEDGTIIEESLEATFAIDSTVPVASDLDVGINAAGNDLHLESELTAMKKIEEVTVKVIGESWSKDFTFDSPKFKEKLSLHFHEHVHVDDAPAGDYQVILTVQDQEGREASVEGTFTKK